MNTWIIIPAHNEEKRITNVIKETKKYVEKIIIVDDGSKDNTKEIAEKQEVEVLRHIVNMGKGAAVKTGCDYAAKKGATKFVIIDADGQHDPNKIPEFLKELEKHDIIFGYRKFRGEMPWVYRFGNWFINKVVRLLFNMKLRDTQCGYRAFTRNAYRKIRWKSGDYFMESEMIANAGKNHLNYKEIPIPTIYADRYKGTTIMDGIKIVINMIIWRCKT